MPRRKVLPSRAGRGPPNSLGGAVPWVQSGLHLLSRTQAPPLGPAIQAKTQSPGIPSLRCWTDSRDSLAQQRHLQDRLPELLRVDPPILMLREGTESSHQVPLDLRMALSELVGHRARGFAHYFEFANYRTLAPPGVREPLVALLQDLLNTVDGTKNVGQSWSVRPGARQSGTASNST